MNPRLRRIQASWRDTLILLGEFRLPLIIFSVALIGGGLLYYWIARKVGEPVNSLIESVYLVLTATFLQPLGGFPHSLPLQLFYFIMPIVGIGILAQGLADFGSLLFNRQARSKEWEMAVASTLNKHIILVGLGHLGYRIVQKLHEMGKNVVVVDLKSSSDTINAVRALNIPVIPDDATRPTALEAANVHEAATIILAGQNDAQNLQIALKARSYNPGIRVVIRIFDDDFAHALQEQFGFNALSATEMAAPAFAASATGADVTNPISVEGQQLSLARLTVKPRSRLDNITIGFVEENYRLNVILLRSNHQNHMPPTDTESLHAGDTLAVLGGPEELSRLLQDNE